MKTFSLITLSQAEVYQHIQAALAADGVEVELNNLSLEVDQTSGNFVVQAHNVRVRPPSPPPPSMIVPAVSLAEARREAAAMANPARAERPAQTVAQDRPRRPFVPVPTDDELGPRVEFDFNRAGNGRAPMGPPPSSEEVNSLTPPPRRHTPAVESDDGVMDHEDLVRANRQLRSAPTYNRPVRGGTIDTMGRSETGET